MAIVMLNFDRADKNMKLGAMENQKGSHYSPMARLIYLSRLSDVNDAIFSPSLTCPAPCTQNKGLVYCL